MDEIKRLNPAGELNPFGNWNGPRIEIKDDAVLFDTIIQDMNMQAAAGIDGWTATRIKMF